MTATVHIWNSFAFERGLHHLQAIANVKNLDISTGNYLLVSLKLGLTCSLVCTRSFRDKRSARLLLYLSSEAFNRASVDFGCRPLPFYPLSLPPTTTKPSKTARNLLYSPLILKRSITEGSNSLLWSLLQNILWKEMISRRVRSSSQQRAAFLSLPRWAPWHRNSSQTAWNPIYFPIALSWTVPVIPEHWGIGEDF